MTTPETHRATGPFEITMVPPQPAYDTVDGVALGRMTINKVLHGDLEGTSVVEMLTAMPGSVQGSGVYVAIERIVGTLKDESGEVHTGSFVVHHTGIMTRGQQQLTVSIVPDSGTGELTSIAGTLKIDVIEGKHKYTLDYTLGGS
jgi:hypothetical protein